LENFSNGYVIEVASLNMSQGFPIPTEGKAIHTGGAIAYFG
jgi:hypothetical protein